MTILTLKVEIRSSDGTAELSENTNAQRIASGEGLVDKVDWDKMHQALDILKEAVAVKGR